MISRYADRRVDKIWSLDEKFRLWQETELAVIRARKELGRIPSGTHRQIRDILVSKPIDVNFIEEREKILHHDLNAFLEERARFLPVELQVFWHERMTSYDTEEAAFARSLQSSCNMVSEDLGALLRALRKLSIEHRHTPMNARTHGQEAELQSFGKRVLTWFKDLDTARLTFVGSMENLGYSKLSGAIGTNSGIDPKLESTALGILGFKPWSGATQIMPRIIYTPIAQALDNMVAVIDKIAIDLRLGARSGRPLWHEPFGKSQKGSSAMP
ncbi:MAG: lyase family protein, partial [Candidatus Paceibacterota bacterium]